MNRLIEGSQSRAGCVSVRVCVCAHMCAHVAVVGQEVPYVGDTLHLQEI